MTFRCASRRWLCTRSPTCSASPGSAWTTRRRSGESWWWRVWGRSCGGLAVAAIVVVAVARKACSYYVDALVGVVKPLAFPLRASHAYIHPCCACACVDEGFHFLACFFRFHPGRGWLAVVCMYVCMHTRWCCLPYYFLAADGVVVVVGRS